LDCIPKRKQNMRNVEKHIEQELRRLQNVALCQAPAPKEPRTASKRLTLNS
jgi:hypothetical protein